MRKFVLALAMAAVLALPGITLAGGLGNYITTVLDDMGNAVINVDPGATIVIDVHIAAPSYLDGAQYSITASKNGVPQGGDLDIIYDASVPYAHLGLFGSSDYFTGVGKNVTLYGGAPLAAPYSNGVAESYMTFNTDPNLVPVPGAVAPGTALARYELHLVGGVVGDVYVITADNDPPESYLSNGWIDTVDPDPSYMAPWDIVNGLTVNVVPEPATALLLIGALPFLRRRR